jgi:hypothetical protein
MVGMYAEFVAFQIPVWAIAVAIVIALLITVLIVWLFSGDRRR